MVFEHSSIVWRIVSRRKSRFITTKGGSTLRYSWTRTIGIILAAALIFVGNQVWAQAPAPPAFGGAHHGHRFHARALFGTIASVSSDSLVLTTWTGRSVTLQTTPATRALSRQQATLTDLAAGDFVHVIATKASNGALAARSISDIPAALAVPPAPAPGGATPSTSGPRVAGQSRMGGGLMSGRDGTIIIAGRLAGVANGTVSITMPAGSPLSVSVPAEARITRLASPPLASLAAGTHVIVRTARPRAPQQPGGTAGTARPPLVAVTIFVVPAGSR